MKHRLLTILTLIVLLVSVVPTNSMADELKGLTLEKEMRAMIERGILQGYGENDYRPKGEVTREQFAAFLARTLDLPTTESNFIDVNPSSALAPFVGAIQVSGLMLGSGNRFMPTKTITREEMALTMSRVILYKQLDVELLDISFEDEGKFTLGGGLEAGKLLASMKVMSGGQSLLGPNTYIFNPKNLSTRDQVAAVLYRYIEFGGQEEPTTPPETDPSKFQLAKIENSKLVLLNKQYNTYAEAVSAFNATPTAQGIYKGKELLRVKSGMAFAQGPLFNNTIIYSSPTFSTQLTYIEAGREMRILEHAENYMKVQVADTIGFVKHSQIDFVPTAISANRDYYIVNSSKELLHYTYNYLTKTYGAYSIGPGPTFMNEGSRYYSSDGVHFLDGAGRVAGTHYPYFQFQSIRTKSDYTAEELESYIMTALIERQGIINQAKYATATTTSKLIGTGAYIKQMEELHRVNALFILAAAMHESDYGISGNAMTKNNLFGIQVFDSTPEAGIKYATPQRSIEAFVLEYANKNYGPPTGAYAKGAVPGNKTAGFNAHYASDPTWGSKIAGHMWRADTKMGGHDFGKYTLAMTTTSGSLNVRTEPTVNSSTLLFAYKARDLGRSGETGYPVVIIDEATGGDGNLWYKVLSDSLSSEHAWIHSNYVRKLPK